MSVPLMRHDIIKNNLFKKNKIIKWTIVVPKTCANKSSFILCRRQVVYKHSGTKYHLEMKFCTDDYFFKTLFFKTKLEPRYGPFKNDKYILFKASLIVQLKNLNAMASQKARKFFDQNDMLKWLQYLSSF